ncbi:AAA family ATPase [Glacieibacterium sp.]|uniref:AAA family ATPase n=1 Tax=Glacieibacterium sp. TaxID=2860237 RepID=UPI003B0050E4
MICDPSNSFAVPVETGAIDLHLHLAELANLTPGLPFLRHAEVVIVEVMLDRPGNIQLFEHFAAGQHAPVIAACRGLTVSGTRALIRAGAIDVVPLPLEPADLDQAIDAARRIIASRPISAAPSGRVISFFRAVGGAGATVIASQAGCMWAANHSTCLIDLDVQFGAAALYLDMQPNLGLLDLIEAKERLDTTLFQTIAARHSSGLHVIAAPPEMVPLEILTPALAGQILATAAQLHEIVLVDLPAAWTSWSLAVLDRSDAVCLVTNLSVPGLRQARRQLDVIEANGLKVPIHIVLNRVPSKMFRTIDMGDSERVLRRKVDITITNDVATVTNAIDQGRPLASVSSKTRVEKDLAMLVARLGQTVVA